MAQSMISLAVFITISQAVVFGQPCTPWTAELTVNTTSGLIKGHPASCHPSVIEFLGIPFAEPPVDNLRFEPPVPYVARESIIADHLPLSCTQSPGSINYSLPQPAQNILAKQGINSSGEDCLYLNVWTKSLYSGAAKKPVLLYIFGGGFHSGSAADPSEQGALWAAEEDVVIVNFNYRLGVFGFPGGAGLSQNVGLLDQRLVVEWVRNNIEAFGGDKTRITLFGHSSGGASVDYYNYAYKDDPIVAGTIAMSGSATTFGHRTPATAQQAWYAMAELLGCRPSNDTLTSAIISCVKGKSTEEVFKASVTAGDQVAATLSTNDQFYVKITGVWSPTTDNQTIFANYSMLGQQGQFIQRPFMTGSNSDEACFFTQRGQIPASDDPLLTQEVFTCPTSWAAIYRASAKLPTWQYRWLGSYPNLEFNDCPGQPWHGQELYVLFGSSVIASGEAATPQEDAAGRYLRRAWTTFARDPTNGLSTKLNWPTLNSTRSEATLVELGLNTTMLSVANATMIDAGCFTAGFLYGGPDY